MKAFKVLDEQTRMGSNAAIFKNRCGEEKLMEVIRKYSLFPYFPRYIRGSIVKKVPRSPGIMAFKTKVDAEKFQWQYALENRTIIVEIEGKLCKNQKVLIHAGGMYIAALKAKKLLKMSPPKGTIFLEYVEVLG